ncbi:MAG: TIGR03756 family integrating conjugative element protein, partial [Betaproteobacteria bacterium HGW-Betaproteobacteria-21]
MTRPPTAPSPRLRAAMASLLLCGATSTFALDTATIVSSAVSPNCLEYRV